MNSYKRVTYWYNELRGTWMAQVGYEIVAEAHTVGGIKRAITAYVKKEA